MRRAPEMWAQTKEAFVAQLVLLLEFEGYPSREVMVKLYNHVLEAKGENTEDCTAEWAVKVFESVDEIRS